MNDFNPDNTLGTAGHSVDGPVAAPMPLQGSRMRRLFSRKRNIAITAGVAVVAVAGIATGLGVTTGSSDSTSSNGSRGPFAATSGVAGSGQGSNARSTNEPGGTSGTVSGVSSAGFTVTTTVGGKITVNESSSTMYANASSGSSTASAITTGAGVLVLGTVNSTTIAATQVTVEPAGSPYTTASSDVTAMQQGQANTSQSYGTIPSDYVEGEGTIVSTSAAGEAVQTALQKYPGGIVDRVVQLANGDYEVHDIGTNIHHVFENSSFQVIGAN